MSTTAIPGSRGGENILLGVLELILGVIALASPLVSSLAVNYMIGIVLIASGCVYAVRGIRAEGARHKLLTFLLGLVAVAAGVLLFMRPVFGLVFVTIVLGAFLVVSGIVQVALAMSLRDTSAWVWMLVSGILGVGLGFMILVTFPLSTVWVAGTYVGAFLFVAGLGRLLGMPGPRFTTRATP